MWEQRMTASFASTNPGDTSRLGHDALSHLDLLYPIFGWRVILVNYR